MNFLNLALMYATLIIKGEDSGSNLNVCNFDFAGWRAYQGVAVKASAAAKASSTN